MVSETKARISEADPAMFYWSGHKDRNFYQENRRACKTWEDIENSELPSEVDPNIEHAKVYGVITMHVDDLQMFGDQDFFEWITKK